MSRCPICKFKLKYDRYFEGSILLEEYTSCKQCNNYHYEFIHGNTRIFIGEKELHYHWNSSKTTTRKTSFIEKKQISKERKKWLKLNKRDIKYD